MKTKEPNTERLKLKRLSDQCGLTHSFTLDNPVSLFYNYY